MFDSSNIKGGWLPDLENIGVENIGVGPWI